MRAVVIRDYEEGSAVQDVEIDAPRTGEVKVRLVASGVCGSDLHLLHGRSVVAKLPMVMGHEGAGIVEEVGPGVTTVARGDHVVLAMYSSCGACRFCRVGHPSLCVNEAKVAANFRGELTDGTTHVSQGGDVLRPFIGLGTMAEYSIVPERQAVAVPKELPLDLLCLAGCGLSTGLGAVFNAANVGPGDTALVIGSGGVGLSVLQGTKISGASTIIAVDTNPAKLQFARKLGATHTINTSEVSLKDAVEEIVPGGVDYAFEAVGLTTLVEEAFTATRPGGTTVMVGSPAGGTSLSLDGRALFSDRHVVGTSGGSAVPQRDIARIVDLYRSGQLDLEGMVSARVPLEDVQRAFDSAEAGTVARSVLMISDQDSDPPLI